MRALRFILLASLFGLSAPSANAYTLGDTVTQDGPLQTVFDWSTQRCVIGGTPDDYDIPDNTARAYRDSLGRVQLIASHAGTPQAPLGHTYRNFFDDGKMWDLGAANFRRDCNNIDTSHNDPDPAGYDNWEWLTSFWTDDGQTIYALSNNEYHAWEQTAAYPYPDPRGCAVSSFKVDCWYNTITLSKSTDGGARFTHDAWPAPTHRVAGSPYTYARDTACPESDCDAIGLFQPTNIVKRSEPGGDTYYSMIRSIPYREQPEGACLMRTRNLADPASWRAWDGNASDDSQQGFTIRFLDPYRETAADPSQHICVPVSPDPPSGGQPSDYRVRRSMTESLTYNTFLDRYLLVGVGDSDGEGSLRGIYYTTSKDLIDWAPRKLMVEIPVNPNNNGDGICGSESPVSNASLIDPDSPDRNFSTTGQFNFLYLTRFVNDWDCPGANFLDRDLIRIPIRFKATERTASGMFFTCPSGFDGGAFQPTSSYFFPSDARRYDSFVGSYWASTATAGATAFGTLTKQGEPPGPLCFGADSERARIGVAESDEASYSAAVFFPNDTFWDKLDAASNPSVTFMRLGPSAGSGWAGSLSVDRNATVRFTTASGTTAEIAAVAIPKRDGCWHQFDVYQKLSSSTGRALNTLYVDGVQAASASTPNWGTASTTSNRLAVGVVAKQNLAQATLFTDRVSFGYSQRPAYVRRCE